MLPSKMAMATPYWVLGPPSWDQEETRRKGTQQPEVQPGFLNALRWGGARMARAGASVYPGARAPGSPICGSPTSGGRPVVPGSAQRPGPQGDLPAQSALAGQVGPPALAMGWATQGVRVSCPQAVGVQGAGAGQDPPSGWSQGKAQPLGVLGERVSEAPKHNLPAPPPAFVKSADKGWGQDGGWLPRPGPPQSPSPSRADVPGAWGPSTH